jgi:hypothetical protein
LVLSLESQGLDRSAGNIRGEFGRCVYLGSHGLMRSTILIASAAAHIAEENKVWFRSHLIEWKWRYYDLLWTLPGISVCLPSKTAPYEISELHTVACCHSTHLHQKLKLCPLTLDVVRFPYSKRIYASEQYGVLTFLKTSFYPNSRCRQH